MSFRSDINGLRAIAVIAVLFYHFGVAGFGGGYVGVDIFFVISGFLMTKIICSKIEAEKFSLLNFYAARAKRIVPALFALLGALLIFGYFYLVPFDYSILGRRAISAGSFFSNIVLGNMGDYFDETSQAEWLLHTWSLGVEWQFYLLFPLYLIGMKKLKSGVWFKQSIVAALLLSLIFSTVYVYFNKTSAFFILPTRIWEFMLGGMVFLYAAKLSKIKYLFETGFIFVMVSITVFTNNMDFPGYVALLPALGATFMIAANKESKMLNNFFMQYFGKISYSLYLWHWPVFVALGYFELKTSALNIILLLIASTALAQLSYSFVETPFRKVKKSTSDKKVLIISFAAFVAVALPALFISKADGLPYRMPKEVQAVLDVKKSNSFFGKLCYVNYKNNRNTDGCHVGDNNIAPEIAIWGDSHSVANTDSLVKLAKANDKSVRFYSFAGCPPILNARFPAKIKGDRCKDVNKDIQQRLIEDKSIEKVLFISRWPIYLHGYNEKPGSHIIVAFKDGVSNSLDTLSQRVQDYSDNLVQTVCGLTESGKEVYLMTPVPEMIKNVPVVLAKNHFLYNRGIEIKIPVSEYEHRNAEVLKAQERAMHECGAKILDIRPFLCDEEFCYATNKEGKILYYDDDHLSALGSALLEPMYKQILKLP